MKSLYRIVGVLAIFLLFTACGSSGENEKVEIKSGEVFQGKMHTNREAERTIKWKINNCNDKDIIVRIILDNNIVFEDANLKGQYNLSEDNADYIISFENNSKDDIKPSIDCKYSRLGTSGTITNTVTNNISLSKK